MWLQSAVKQGELRHPRLYSPQSLSVIELTKNPFLRSWPQKTAVIFASAVTKFAQRPDGRCRVSFSHPPFSSPIKNPAVDELAFRALPHTPAINSQWTGEADGQRGAE